MNTLTQRDDSAAISVMEAKPLLPQADKVWRTIRDECLSAIDQDAAVDRLVRPFILDQASLEDALCSVLASKLADTVMDALELNALLRAIVSETPRTLQSLRCDMRAVLDRDPACNRLIEPLLYFKGFQALQTQRFAASLWQANRRDLALHLQSRASAVFQVDIHPGTQLGAGIFLDHATGIVIGETAVIDDDVSIMQGVTLGGTGKDAGDRHPKVRCGVLVGAGAKVLGNIELGRCARVAASSVVLDPIPAFATVAGIPAKIVSIADRDEGCMPAVNMDQTHLGKPHLDGGGGI